MIYFFLTVLVVTAYLTGYLKDRNPTSYLICSFWLITDFIGIIYYIERTFK